MTIAELTERARQIRNASSGFDGWTVRNAMLVLVIRYLIEDGAGEAAELVGEAMDRAKR